MTFPEGPHTRAAVAVPMPTSALVSSAAFYPLVQMSEYRKSHFLVKPCISCVLVIVDLFFPPLDWLDGAHWCLKPF